jgi:dienelactone hydrolase
MIVNQRALTVLASTLLALASTAPADVPRALPPGTLPQDVRLGKLRTLDDYFPFTPVESPQAWAKRAEQLRRQAQVATGLWPTPTRTPLEATVHGKVDRDDYTVEKVYFQSYPGHFVTGNLYRPKGKPQGAKLPAVLCPHGHWANGRFYDAGVAETRKQIAIGAERFEAGGRYPLQARCVQLARMGCVVLMYDMVGVADSVQIDHRPGVRESMNTKENWGFFSPQAELHLQNMMGLQTWNSVRALDFITSLPEVDAKKVAVTGASGGGTQTFMLFAVDERPALSAPNVMVSTAMQGGCTCENAPYLRIGAGNIDIAALAAPKPLNLVAANDWTKEVMTKGYPDLKNLYKMLGHEDRLHAEAFVHFEHNYNAVSRSVVYTFINKHFGLGFPEPVIERDYTPLSREEMSVWDAQHLRPSGDKAGDAHERALLKWMTDDAAKQVDALTPKPNDAKSLDEYRRVVGGAWDTIIGRRLEDVGSVEHELKDKVDKGSYIQMASLLTLHDQGEQVPVLFLHPKGGWNKQVVVWLDEAGKAGLLEGDGSPKAAITKLLQAGYSVVGPDLLFQGEFLKDAQPGTKADARIAPYGNGREAWQQAAVYTFGYNRPLFAHRVHDVLTVVRFVQTDQHETEKIHLVGLGPVAGPIAAAARAQAGGAINKAAIDTRGFRFASLDRLADPMFVPGAARYHDVPGLLALNAPQPLWVAGESESPERAADAYAAAGQGGALVKGKVSTDPSAAVEWLMR